MLTCKVVTPNKGIILTSLENTQTWISYILYSNSCLYFNYPPPQTKATPEEVHQLILALKQDFAVRPVDDDDDNRSRYVHMATSLTRATVDIAAG